MDTAGLASTIGTVAATGFKITRAISAACVELGTEAASLREIADDAKFVTMIL